MNFRGLKFWIPILIYMLSIDPALATSFYTWTGTLEVGQSVYINGIHAYLDKDNRTGKLALVLESPEGIELLYSNRTIEIQGLTIGLISFKDYGVISVKADRPFSVSFNTTEDYQKQVDELKKENAQLKSENERLSKQVQSLTKENKKLKTQVDSLKKENAQLKEKLKSQPNTAELNAKIMNLTKQNRALKAELANLTRQYNALKAKADFLEQQNEEYRQIIQQVMNEQSSEAKQSYIEKAKKERLIGSVLLKSLIGSVVLVGLVGYGLYRKKRSWELGGL